MKIPMRAKQAAHDDDIETAKLTSPPLLIMV